MTPPIFLASLSRGKAGVSDREKADTSGLACQAAAAPQCCGSSLAPLMRTKGGISHDGEESQGREEEGWQEAVTSPTRIRGAAVAPLNRTHLILSGSTHAI